MNVEFTPIRTVVRPSGYALFRALLQLDPNSAPVAVTTPVGAHVAGIQWSANGSGTAHTVPPVEGQVDGPIAITVTPGPEPYDFCFEICVCLSKDLQIGSIFTQLLVVDGVTYEASAEVCEDVFCRDKEAESNQVAMAERFFCVDDKAALECVQDSLSRGYNIGNLFKDIECLYQKGILP